MPDDGPDNASVTRRTSMQPWMKNPAMIVPDAMQALLALAACTGKTGVPAATLALVPNRVSQINGCSVCVDMGARHLKKAGETDERIFAVFWCPEAPWFTDAEPAATVLAFHVSR